ncbi:tautomerase family protein [Pseudooceanicola sp. MF1-13]|uniref:tautomerase family protein n=1 Tax=Pseudooceanicola sp. MF1-13 TaxID=3379095 RepID=UPI0038912C89
MVYFCDQIKNTIAWSALTLSRKTLMPLNKLHVPCDLPVETCIQVNTLLHAALVQHFAVNPEDDFCIVMRYAREDMMLHPTFLGPRDPEASIIIDITLMAGRTDARKEAFYSELRYKLQKIGFPPDNAIVFLTENNPIDWSFSRGGSVKKVLAL